MPRFPEPWLETAPDHWPTLRGKRVLQRRKTLNAGLKETNRLALTMSGVIRRSLEDVDGLQTEDYSNYQLFDGGDLVFKLIDLQNVKTSRVGLVPERGIMSPAYIRLRCRMNGVLPNYAFWWFTHLYWRQVFNALGGGVRQSLDPEELLGLSLPVPPRDEQRRIAIFLDRKTAAIDDLIEKKERLIELLQEKRQALITHAVTKGLDGNVPMNRVGLPWTGPFPQHWATARLSHFAVVSNGSTPDRTRADYWEDGTIPWLSSGKVNDYVVTEADQFITPLALKECSVSLVRPGAVLVGLIGEGRTRGMSAFLELSACINQNMAAVVPGARLDGHFLHAVLIAAYEELRVLGRGGQQDALNCQILGSFRFPLPPLEEQRRISTQLSAGTMAVDRVVARIGQHVTLLKELRQALISAAVTGQLDLSKEAA